MKAVLACFVALVALGAAFTDDQLYDKYVEWSKLYRKERDSLDHVKRFENFKTNYAIVRHLNRQGHAHFALNEFADLSPEEFESLYLHPMQIPEAYLAPFKYNKYAQYPETKDWRDEGAVNKVVNQGSCGSCWAFSAVANMEGVWFVKHRTELPVLSQQQLVDCDHECMIYQGEESCDEGCNGGLMPNAFTYAIKYGMESAGDYPYTGRSGTCKYDATKAKYKFTSQVKVEANEEAMVAAINDLGPLSVAVCASSWSFYSGGIFDSNCCTTLNHGVTIVGYGADNGKQYWIIRNSWGTSWGISGYMKLARGHNRCAVNDFACSIVA